MKVGRERVVVTVVEDLEEMGCIEKEAEDSDCQTVVCDVLFH